MKDFLTTPVPHDEAAEFIASKPAVPRSVFNRLLPELKARAITVTGLESATAVQNVRDAIAELPRGGDWDTIKRQIASQMSPYFIDDDADAETQAGQKIGADRRAELLLRLHGFQSYSTAAHRALDAQRDIFPYWQYKSMGDGRVRATHRALHDIVLPAGDPFWRDHTGPWEYGCRCQKVGLMEIDVDEIRAADQDKPIESRRIIEGEARTQLENGRLVKGPNLIFDVRTPQQKGKADGFSWNPDDLRIPLETLKSRYDADVWQAFESWAQATAIPGQGRTVWEWLAGNVALRQPDLTGPDGAPIFVPPALAASVTEDFLSDGEAAAGPSFLPLDGVPAADRAAILAFERDAAGRAREHARIYTPDGREIWRVIGDAGRVAVPQSEIPGNIFTHNHPAGTPFSLEDIIEATRYRAREIRVVTPSYLYSMRPTGSGFGHIGDIRINWQSLYTAVAAIAIETHRSQGGAFPHQTADARFLHAVWMELARRNLIAYRRISL